MWGTLFLCDLRLPDGDRVEDNSAAYVSLFIALVSEGADVRALFQLTLLDQSGKERQKVQVHFGRPLVTCPYTLKYRGRDTSDFTKVSFGDIRLSQKALLHFIYWDSLPDLAELLVCAPGGFLL
ncbi:hypothetical protein Tsubulata_025746 [Turnera subulata]|uniref:Uncharacterized protein n=1 Tax=Turnera subulata TaxID=218843 RepID=A0A9Q0FIU1_9ROSI|nr:hypothetical protein Tsubulata_025746 [Turnera subulata]